jgi:hypothetical protein
MLQVGDERIDFRQQLELGKFWRGWRHGSLNGAYAERGNEAPQFYAIRGNRSVGTEESPIGVRNRFN